MPRAARKGITWIAHLPCHAMPCHAVMNLAMGIDKDSSPGTTSNSGKGNTMAQVPDHIAGKQGITENRGIMKVWT